MMVSKSEMFWASYAKIGPHKFDLSVTGKIACKLELEINDLEKKRAVIIISFGERN